MDKPNDWFKCGDEVHAAIRKAERERVLAEVETWAVAYRNHQVAKLIAKLRGAP
jgi:hypothetical protein